MNPINIVCLKWGTKFSPKYVNCLYAGVRRHTTVAFQFHCFTDNPTGVHPDVIIHPLPYQNTLKGWWNKLYLFSNQTGLQGRVVYVDLDTLVVGNLDELLTCTKSFIALKDFYISHRDPLTNRLASGLMAWDAGKHIHIWERFIQNPEAVIKRIHPGGDQEWINTQQEKRFFWQNLFPDQVVSYKTHCLGGLPTAARIVCYHGIPSIEDSISKRIVAQNRVCNPAPWVADHWREE